MWFSSALSTERNIGSIDTSVPLRSSCFHALHLDVPQQAGWPVRLVFASIVVGYPMDWHACCPSLFLTNGRALHIHSFFTTDVVNPWRWHSSFAIARPLQVAVPYMNGRWFILHCICSVNVYFYYYLPILCSSLDWRVAASSANAESTFNINQPALTIWIPPVINEWTPASAWRRSFTAGFN